MRHARLLAVLLGLASATCLVGLRLMDPQVVVSLREFVFDEFQRLSPRAFTDQPVRIVDIDERSLAALGQWPWSRDRLATLVERLGALGAGVVAFDMVFPEPDRLSPINLIRGGRLRALVPPTAPAALPETELDHDARFAEAIAAHPVVLGFGVVPGEAPPLPPVKAGFAFTGAEPASALLRFAAATANLPRLQEAAAGIGAISLSTSDRQGIVRQIPMLWSGGGRTYPSLSLEALRIAQDAGAVVVQGTPQPPAAVETIDVGAFSMPTTRQGELRLYLTHDDPRRYVSVLDILSDGWENLRPRIEGHIILVGTSATGLLDIRATPLGQSVPGVSLHAQALEQVIGGQHLRRPDWADPFEVLWTLLIGVSVVLAAILSRPSIGLAAGGVLALLTSAGSWIAFREMGLLLDPVYANVAGLGLFFAITSFRIMVIDRDKRRVRRAFAHYVSPGVLDEIEGNPGALKLGGEDRHLSIMFIDVRGFTSLSETMRPAQVIAFLNTILGAFSREIVREQGTIDKYIGDAIMAFWNAPTDVASHEMRACRAALAIRRALADLNASGAFALDPDRATRDVSIGIGINSGTCFVGNMGSEELFNYSAIGDAVNTASRIEGITKDLGVDILVSSEVAQAAGALAFLPAGSLRLRGREQATTLFTLVGDERARATPAFRDLEAAHLVLLRSGDAGDAQALRRCRELAAVEFPMLSRFYDRLDEAARTRLSHAAS
jgi:adenylate cyclase